MHTSTSNIQCCFHEAKESGMECHFPIHQRHVHIHHVLCESNTERLLHIYILVAVEIRTQRLLHANDKTQATAFLLLIWNINQNCILTPSRNPFEIMATTCTLQTVKTQGFTIMLWSSKLRGVSTVVPKAHQISG